MCPVSQSNSWWQSAVGTGWAERGGGAPSCAYRDRLSGMFTSAVYLHIMANIFYPRLYIFFHLLPLPPYVPDEGVGHAVPGGGPAGGGPQHGVRPQVRGRVDDGHRGAVTRYVVTWAAAVIIVTCHVRCERCTVRTL